MHPAVHASPKRHSIESSPTIPRMPYQRYSWGEADRLITQWLRQNIPYRVIYEQLCQRGLPANHHGETRLPTYQAFRDHMKAHFNNGPLAPATHQAYVPANANPAALVNQHPGPTSSTQWERGGLANHGNSSHLTGSSDVYDVTGQAQDLLDEIALVPNPGTWNDPGYGSFGSGGVLWTPRTTGYGYSSQPNPNSTTAPGYPPVDPAYMQETYYSSNLPFVFPSASAHSSQMQYSGWSVTSQHPPPQPPVVNYSRPHVGASSDKSSLKRPRVDSNPDSLSMVSGASGQFPQADNLRINITSGIGSFDDSIQGSGSTLPAVSSRGPHDYTYSTSMAFGTTICDDFGIDPSVRVTEPMISAQPKSASPSVGFSLEMNLDGHTTTQPAIAAALTKEFLRFHGMPCDHEKQYRWNEVKVCSLCGISPVLEDMWRYVSGPNEARIFLEGKSLEQRQHRDKAGNSVLHHATAAGASCDTLKTIMALGVPKYSINSSGETFLHLARLGNMLVRSPQNGQYDWQRLLAHPDIHPMLGCITVTGKTIRQCWMEQIQGLNFHSRREHKPAIDSIFDTLGYGKETEQQAMAHDALYDLLMKKDLERRAWYKVSDKCMKANKHMEADKHVKSDKHVKWMGDLANLWESKSKRVRRDLQDPVDFEIGFNPCAQDDNGDTALMKYVAARHKEEIRAVSAVREVAKYVRKWGMADGINMKNKKGQAALHHAASSGNSNLTRTLILEGANPNACDDEGKSVLRRNLEAIAAAQKASNRDSGLFLSLLATKDVLSQNEAVLQPTILQQRTKTKNLELDEELSRLMSSPSS